MTGPTKGIRVEIYDSVYMLRAEAEEAYTRRLAQLVDTTMRSLAEKTHTFDSLRLAVLAALHFADECERQKERYQELAAAVAEKSAAFSEALEHAAEKTA